MRHNCRMSRNKQVRKKHHGEYIRGVGGLNIRGRGGRRIPQASHCSMHLPNEGTPFFK